MLTDAQCRNAIAPLKRSGRGSPTRLAFALK